jgi:hypothetical protein
MAVGTKIGTTMVIACSTYQKGYCAGCSKLIIISRIGFMYRVVCTTIDRSWIVNGRHFTFSNKGSETHAGMALRTTFVVAVDIGTAHMCGICMLIHLGQQIFRKVMTACTGFCTILAIFTVHALRAFLGTA